ncbi:MAG: ferric iron reductase [Caldilineaceae bacterium]
MHIHPNEHPLHQTFTRIHQLNHYVGAHLSVPRGAPTPPAWLTPSELLAPDSPRLSALISATQKRLHTETANTIGGALLQEYQWPLIASAVACFLVDRRVPALHPENVCLRVSVEEHEDESVEPEPPIAYTSGRFAALPADPAADHPDATIVPDEDALRAYLRTGLETHFGWVIERLSAATGCNQRGLWALCRPIGSPAHWLGCCRSRINTSAWLLSIAPPRPLFAAPIRPYRTKRWAFLNSPIKSGRTSISTALPAVTGTKPTAATIAAPAPTAQRKTATHRCSSIWPNSTNECS